MKHGESSKNEIILAGIEEIEQHGIRDFSLRRVAANCGLSCAAPYKHFKNKEELILEIIRYIKLRWYDYQAQIIDEYEGDVRRQLGEISIGYVRFLVANPGFRSIIMISEDDMDEEQRSERAELSARTKILIHKYCQSVSMPYEDAVRKTFVVRSLIYGAALMIGNGELENTEGNYNMIKAMISREFDLA